MRTSFVLCIALLSVGRTLVATPIGVDLKNPDDVCHDAKVKQTPVFHSYHHIGAIQHKDCDWTSPRSCNFSELHSHHEEYGIRTHYLPHSRKSLRQFVEDLRKSGMPIAYTTYLFDRFFDKKYPPRGEGDLLIRLDSNGSLCQSLAPLLEWEEHPTSKHIMLPKGSAISGAEFVLRCDYASCSGPECSSSKKNQARIKLHGSMLDDVRGEHCPYPLRFTFKTPTSFASDSVYFDIANDHSGQLAQPDCSYIVKGKVFSPTKADGYEEFNYANPGPLGSLYVDGFYQYALRLDFIQSSRRLVLWGGLSETERHMQRAFLTLKPVRWEQLGPTGQFLSESEIYKAESFDRMLKAIEVADWGVDLKGEFAGGLTIPMMDGVEVKVDLP